VVLAVISYLGHAKPFNDDDADDDDDDPWFLHHTGSPTILVFLAPNFVMTFQQHDLQIQGQIQVGIGVGKMWFSALKQLVSRKL